MKIVSTTIIKEEIRNDLIKKYPKISFESFRDINEADRSLGQAEILITYGEDLSEQIIERMKQLKWIMVISAGLDLLPFDSLKKRNILVTNARGIHQIPMAEYTISMMLQVARNTKQLIEHEQAGIWDRTVPMMELHGKTIGILGTGAIGTEIARYAKVFKMETIGFNRSGKRIGTFDKVVSLENIDQLLTSSDFVVSVLPSTNETNELINGSMFEQMKNSAVFINIGRGKNVNETDLLAALEEQKIAHAVLDVFVEEPLPKRHPFWKMDNVTVTPHLSGISPQYIPRAMKIFEENLETYLNADLNYINEVDLDRGY